MASRIFMGNMPELMEDILNNLNNDIYSLYSCALPEIFYLLEHNEQFFSQLQDLWLYIPPGLKSKSATTLLRILAKSATKISALKLNAFFSDYEWPQLFHALTCVIKSQEQLRKFSLVGEEYLTEFHGIISVLESQKNSLREIIIDNCAYSAEFEILKNCKKLEILRICDSNYWELLKILNCKISTLVVGDSRFAIDVSTIVQLLERSGILLQQLNLETGVESRQELLLLEAIKSFCPNITYLNLSYIEFSTQLLDLIGNLQKLQFLTLWCNLYIPEETKIRVTQFAEILPSTLQYLDLGVTWLESYIDIILNHCNAPLKKLLFNYIYDKKTTKALINFCKRNRTLNYVGLRDYSYLNENIQKELEVYVTLVPTIDIIVNC
ncbi:hypothetical protein F8M41_017193 [Gigaspora margarita]|uniref:F-box domain-containing protein n=1 Tax=Gigaspora margarita TaxID=4874 RepID=A0A8H4B2U4_GIGMA|nr:hypothetical protein F8M41_017193 [Gigaspora margarita]